MHSPVVLTGGTGYLGSQILHYLLESEYEVRLTTRSVEKTQEDAYIKTVLTRYKSQLSLYEADLLQEGSFDEVMKGAKGLIHAASPFKISGIKDAKKELINPAVQGTKNVLDAASKSETVKKVVLTSSVVAVYGDAKDIELVQEDVFNESHWNQTSSISHHPYAYSKTVAEKKAWSLEQNANFSLVTINPGFILGPANTQRIDSESISFMRDMLNGKFSSGVPSLYFGYTDVRDCAKVHVKALENDNASGRHICVSEEGSMLDVASILSREFGTQYKIPKAKLPKFLVYIIGPLNGLSWNFLNKNLSIPLHFDNSKIKESLGITFRPLSETVVDHAKQLIKDGLLKKK